jgi:GNAT superfamily N-acetyltransferase
MVMSAKRDDMALTEADPTPDSLARDSPIAVRAYNESDEPRVFDLLQDAFGKWPRGIDDHDPAEVFRWKHLANPFGRSVMVVSEADDALVGFAALMRWRLLADGGMFEVLRGVDMAVHPAYRRRGVYSQLLREAARRYPPDTALTLNSPNQQSRRGSLQVGGHEIGRLPSLVRVRSPLRSSAGLLSAKLSGRARSVSPPVSADSAADVLRNGESIATLLSQLERPIGRFATHKDVDYLRWRYGTVGCYHVIREDQVGSLAGLAIFRVHRRGRVWLSTVCEMLVADRTVARRLLRRVGQAAATDYVVGCFPPGSSARHAAVRCGFVPVSRGPGPTVRPLKDNISPDPTDRNSWAICSGDLDLL